MTDAEIYQELIPALQKAEALEKQAAQDSQVLPQKTQHDWNTFQYVLGHAKTARLREIAQAVMKEPVARGLSYATGAAIPVGLLGSHLIDRAGDEQKEVVEDARNKALQTALGVGAIGAGLYGIHRLTQPRQKEGSDIESTLEYLRATGLLDETLAAQPQTEKIAALRLLNAEHGVDLLRQLLS